MKANKNKLHNNILKHTNVTPTKLIHSVHISEEVNEGPFILIKWYSPFSYDCVPGNAAATSLLQSWLGSGTAGKQILTHMWFYNYYKFWHLGDYHYFVPNTDVTEKLKVIKNCFAQHILLSSLLIFMSQSCDIDRFSKYVTEFIGQSLDFERNNKINIHEESLCHWLPNNANIC